MDFETKRYKILVDTEYGGFKIQLFDTFDKEILNVINKYEVTSILLSQWKGWKTQPLDFLAKIKNIRVIAIFDDAIQDLSILEQLDNLEVLYLECPKAKSKVDFSLLKKIRDVRFDWRPCFSSICDNNTVKTILINGYKESDFSLFNSNSLERLDIVRSGKLASLRGVECLPNLKSLMLYQCRKLTDISPLRSTNLERLEIESCKKIEKLELIFDLANLKCISLDKCGTLAGVSGVSKLKLDNLIISETKIENGDLQEFFQLRGCKIYFDNKKYYSHSLEEVRSMMK